MCWFFFFNSPRHSGANVGNDYVILYTKSHQASDGRKIVSEKKQRCLFLNLLKNTFLWKKSSFFPFHSGNPWQVRQKRRLKKSICRIAKNYMTSCCTFNDGPTWLLWEASPAISDETAGGQMCIWAIRKAKMSIPRDLSLTLKCDK